MTSGEALPATPHLAPQFSASITSTRHKSLRGSDPDAAL